MIGSSEDYAENLITKLILYPLVTAMGHQIQYIYGTKEGMLSNIIVQEKCSTKLKMDPS